jgi:hypothetical protein
VSGCSAAGEKDLFHVRSLGRMMRKKTIILRGIRYCNLIILIPAQETEQNQISYPNCTNTILKINTG